MKIGIATTFYRLDPGYSLCAVVIDQLEALLSLGYHPVLFVLPSFNDEVPEGVEVRKVVPQLILEPYKGLKYPDHWKEDVAKARDLFEKNMADIDKLIIHDWHFIDTYLPYWIALREALETLKDIQIFAWTHSAPSGRPKLEDNPHANRFTLPERTKLVYLNHDKANELAEMYGAWLKDVRVIHNSRDPRTFWKMHPLTRDIIDQYDLFSADVISVYPLSTPRMISGKGLDKVVKIHSKLKELGYSTRIIVCNAHANAERDKRMIAETKVWAADLGVDQSRLVFTSEMDPPNNEAGVPAEVVSDLFRISNVFIFPTISENSSLVLLEAMLSGNLLVLNSKVGTLREHAGDNALYFDFDYREPKEDNENYYLDLAKITASQLGVDKSLQSKMRALQQFNYNKTAKDLDLLLHEE